MKTQDWYLDVNMNNGQVSLPWFTSLGGFWPGLQVLYGALGFEQDFAFEDAIWYSLLRVGAVRSVQSLKVR